METLDQFESLLREGLRDIPAPTPSRDFDAVVLAALRRPRSRWRLLWDSARPVLGGAVCSLTVMLALLHWTSDAPVVPTPVAPGTTVSRPINMQALQKALEQPNLTVGTLALLSADPEMLEEPPPAAKPNPPAVDRHRGPIRRAGLLRNSPVFV